MKILKHGFNEERKFVCRRCGCEYLATRDECIAAHSLFGEHVIWKCDCPECLCLNTEEGIEA